MLSAICNWISFTLDCSLKAFVLTQIEHTWMILSIFPTLLQDNVFHFSQMEEPHISMFPAATNVSDWPFYFCATNLLLGHKVEQSDNGRSLCSVKGKRIIFQSYIFFFIFCHTKSFFNKSGERMLKYLQSTKNTMRIPEKLHYLQ